MRALAEVFWRTWWWFSGTHLRYERYYGIAAIRHQGFDPRAMRRAREKAGLLGLVLLYLAFVVGVAVLEIQLRFPQSFGPPMVVILGPGSLLYLTFTYAWAPYHNLHLAAQIAAAFTLAWKVAAIGCAIAVTIASRTFHSTKYDRSDLTTEEGAARWITPDELAVAKLLPPGYDPVLGYTKEATRRQQRQRNALSTLMPTAHERERAPRGNIGLAVAGTVLAALALVPFIGHDLLSIALATIGFLALTWLLTPRIGFRKHAIAALAGALAGAIASPLVAMTPHPMRLAFCAGVGAALGLVFASTPPAAVERIRADRRAQTIALAIAVASIITGAIAHQSIGVIILLAIGTGTLAVRTPAAAIALALAPAIIVLGGAWMHHPRNDTLAAFCAPIAIVAGMATLLAEPDV